VQYTEPTSIPLSPIASTSHSDPPCRRRSRRGWIALQRQRGRRVTPMPVNYPSSSILHSHAACRNRASNPIRRRSPPIRRGRPQPASQHATDSRSATWAIPILMGAAGAPDTKQESYSSTFIMHSSAASRERVSNPISPSPAPTTPVSRRRRTRRSALCGCAGPRLRSGGTGAIDARELLKLPSCAPVQYPGEGTISRPIL
jgi:hypothetical protein